MKTKVISKKMSLPVSVAISMSTTIILMLLACAAIASMIMSGNIQEEKTGIITKIILAIAVFVGNKLNISLEKQDRYIATGVYTGAVMLLCLVTGLIFRSRMANILISLLFVLCGAAVGILFGNKKVKKHAYSKKHYR